MKRRFGIMLLVIALVSTLFGCASDNPENYSYYEKHCKNETKHKDCNYITFSSDSVDLIQTLDVIMQDENGSVLEQFRIENPGADDIYNISPTLTGNNKDLTTYEVVFVVNDTYSWSRWYQVEEEIAGTRINVISGEEGENGLEFGSVVAG